MKIQRLKIFWASCTTAWMFFLIVSLFSFNRIYLLSSTHLGIDGAFKPAAQVAADEQTANFRKNVQKGFEHLDHKLNEVINLNLKIYKSIRNIHNAISIENSPPRHSPSPRSFSPLNNPPLPSHQLSSPLSTLSAASVPPSPKIPSVNLIKPTPDNSQKKEQPSTQLVPTSPSPNPILEFSINIAAAALLTTLLVTEPSPSPTNEVQAVALPMANFDSPEPPCPSPRRTRSRTPVPSLGVPDVSPHRTQSVTRSRSPTPRPRG